MVGIRCTRCNPPKEDFGDSYAAYIQWCVHMAVAHRNFEPAEKEAKKNRRAVRDAMKKAGKKPKKKGSSWSW